MDYIAHRISDSDKKQSILEHLSNTAVAASVFADTFDAADEGYFCGMLHDIGKYSAAFQRRIRGSPEHVDHSTAGTLVAAREYRDIPAAFCIAGHHGGLPDGGNPKFDTADDTTLSGRLKRGAVTEDFSAYKNEVSVPGAKIAEKFMSDGFSRAFFVRMLYSCLVDADFLDTEAFMSEDAVTRGAYEGPDALPVKLNEYISPWWDAKTEINRKRCEILRSCIRAAGGGRGLFALTVPTGAGKTVSSMAFALNHAKKHRMKRVIYVIPYTSIIEQTQSVFEKIFGAENVVAHYANVEYRNDENGGSADRRALAAENWDAPIVLTTSVQFFESLYGNRPSRCRKLHNIAGSVIIFDEAQMLPVPYLRPCVATIAQLVKNYGCTAVLCTATQPSLNRLFEEALPGYGIENLCSQDYSKEDIFQRVSLIKAGKLNDGELSRRLNEERQVLCIVNSRRQAQEVYSALSSGAFHLSTAMTPYDRRGTLDEIRRRLQDGRPCRVVSTSLVEAGVDVDFPTVYRAIAGLDSIIQAAGRCNREGKRPPAESRVYIFDTERKPPRAIEQNIAAAREAMRRFDSFSSPEAVSAYFDFLYYTLKDENALDAHRILHQIQSPSMPFAAVAEQFKIIEDAASSAIIVPEGGGAALTAVLRRHGPSRELLRKLGPYTVGAYPKQFGELLSSGAAEWVSENAAVLLDMSLYSEQTGLRQDLPSGGREFIV